MPASASSLVRVVRAFPMATRPGKPPFSRYHKTESGKERALATILTQRPDIVGERKLSRDTTALEHAKKLLAEDTTPKQKRQLKTAWDYGEDCYVKWERACAEFDEAQGNEPEDYGDGDLGDRKRKRQDKKNEADEKAKELRDAYDQMQRTYDADRPEAIRRFAEKLEELSNEPAFAAMGRYGMCACSASHALAKSVGLCVAVAAETYWRAHPVIAPREPLDVPKLLREVLARVPDLSGADSASGQWNLLKSETCPYLALALPPARDFDEVKVRGNYESRTTSTYTNRLTEWGRGNLDTTVMHWTGLCDKAVRALSHQDKINSIVEARRKAHQAPIDKICKDAVPLFEGLVKCRTSAPEFCDVQTCVSSIGHGHAIATTSHCGFLDADKVDYYIGKFKAAQEAGAITDPQDFYYDGTGHSYNNWRECLTTGQRLTESLRSDDSPLPMTGAEGRISMWGEGDLYATDLSKTKLVLGFVVDGGVKNVDDVETKAGGRLVVALHRRGELYYFLITRGHFLLANEFTPACAVKIMQIAGPLLYLTYAQDTGAVPRLKKEERGGGGLVVGKSANGEMISDFKVALPKMVARGVSKGLIEFE